MSADAPRQRIGLPQRLRAVGAPLLLMALIIALWQFLVWVLEIKSYVLPAPSAIAAEVFVERAVIFPQLRVTLFEIFAGYGLAVAVGFVLSVLIVYLPAFRRGVLPLIVASQTIPVIAIAPILVIWFGYNALPRIIITALVAFFPLTVNFVTGLQSVSNEFINFFRSLNASEAQIFRKLRFPAALPNIFAGLKVASTLAVIGATIGEWVGASAGLGYLMSQDSAQLNTTRVFASLVVLGIVGMLFFAAVGLIERLCMPWVYGRLRVGWLPQRFERSRLLQTKSTAG
jgi:ABC-type nitrate/sulfonate/bicarbonate transport system permease component